jgi:hypothetical protein
MKRPGKPFRLAIVVVLLLVVRSTFAVSEKAELRAEVKLHQVSLFKNGLGFFVSEVTCPDKDSFTFEPAGLPCHGTFWVSCPPEVKLEKLTAKEIETQQATEAVNISELLRANVGKKVGLYFADSNKPSVEGVIEYITQPNQGPDAQPGPYSFGRYASRIDPYVKNLMMIKTASSQVAVDPARVIRVDFLDDKASKTFYNKSAQLEIKLAKAAAGKKLTVSYLSRGITWAPSYIVDITEGDKALLSAKAEVINEVCDLNNVTIQLVTGFPNLLFADVVSPLALKENLEQFLYSLTEGQTEEQRQQRRLGVRGNVMYQSAGMRRAEIMTALSGPVMPQYGSAEMGKVAEDLFVYPVEKMNLAKGQVGYLPLFTESVPCEHIYRWEIPDYINEKERYRYEYERPERQEPEPEQEVWHCLRMTNTTKVPWTTAPAEIVSAGLILGQDILNYTPIQGKQLLRITKAVSIKAEQSEIETARKRDALQLYGGNFDLVTIEGKLLVTDFQPKAVTIEITKTLSGEVKSSEPQAKIETMAKGLLQMNGIRKLTWVVELKSGEQKQLGYTYDVYVRR